MLYRIFCFVFFSSLHFHLAAEDFLEKQARENNIVLSTKRINLENYPGAFNPSIIQFGDEFLMTFRYTPDPLDCGWISHIGLVILDEHFDPISEPELLNTRHINSKTDSQSEDARIFSYRGRLFLTYNDCIDVYQANWNDRRDIYISELFYDANHFYLSKSLKLLREEKRFIIQQKNWMPL